MLDAFGHLLCFKLCQHNRPVPTMYYVYGASHTCMGWLICAQGKIYVWFKHIDPVVPAESDLH